MSLHLATGYLSSPKDGKVWLLSGDDSGNVKCWSVEVPSNSEKIMFTLASSICAHAGPVGSFLVTPCTIQVCDCCHSL